MRSILLLILILTPLISFSQKKSLVNFTVNGKIIDSETKKPIEDASIVFKYTDSSSIIYGGITNSRGNFSVDVEEGTYSATVNYICYQPKEINISEISRDLNIGTIELEIDTNKLNEIEIIGSQKAVQLKPNKIIYHAEKDIVSSGGVTTDLLNNIPSINVESDGNVKIRGQQATVMINGRVSPMTKGEALNSIPASSIEKIEVYFTPGSSYSASYNCIVNLILKRKKNEGFNASIMGTVGYKNLYGGLFTLNYKTKNYNLFTTTNYGHSNPIIMANYNSKYFENGISLFLNETNESNSVRNNYYGLVGVEIYASKKTTITPQISYSNLNFENKSITETDFFNASNILQSSNSRNFFSDFKDKISEYSIEIDHKFNEGKTLKASYSFSDDNENFDRLISNTNSEFTNEDFIEKNNLKSSLVDIKYNHSLNDHKSISVGYNGEYGTINFLKTGNELTSNIDYIDDIHGIYAEFENQKNKFYYGIGLRAEFSSTIINYENLNTNQTQKYNDLFPSIYLSYDFNDHKSISLSSNRKIVRPNYYEIQPFEEKTSETSSYIGNENLQPIYIYANNFVYSYISNNISIFSTLFFNQYNNYSQIVTYKTGEKINGIDKLISSIENVGSMKYYGLNISLIYEPSKIVSFNGNILFNKFDQTGIFTTINNANENINIDYKMNSFSGNFSLLSQFKFPKLFNFQTNIKHFLESEGAISTRKAYTYASAAISKDLFNNNASIGLNIDDIFYSNKTNRDRYSDDYFQNTRFQNKYRTIKLSFTYRFNQNKKERAIDFERKQNKPNY